MCKRAFRSWQTHEQQTSHGHTWNEMGQGRSEVMEWAKEAQNNMNTSPMIILGHWN